MSNADDEKPAGRWLLFGFLFALTAVLSLAFVWWIGPYLLTSGRVQNLTQADTLKAVNDVRTALVATLIGLAAIGSLLVTGINARINQQTLRATLQSIENSQRAQSATEESQRRSHELALAGQVTERFARAVELLSDKSAPDIRIGGIYALERVAKDSDRDRDQETIVEILSAFVRSRADKSLSPRPDLMKLEGMMAKSSAEISDAMDVLGRLPRDREVRSIDLGRIRLLRLDLSSSDFRRVRFNGAELINCNFSNVRLTDGRLSDAFLEGSDFTGADLSKAKLGDGDLRKATFRRTNMTGAVLLGARYGAEQFTVEQLAKAFEGD